MDYKNICLDIGRASVQGQGHCQDQGLSYQAGEGGRVNQEEPGASSERKVRVAPNCLVQGTA